MLAIAISGCEVRYIIWDRSGQEVRLVACQVIPWEREMNPLHDVARVREILQQIFTEAGELYTVPVYLALDAGFCHFSVIEVDPTWEVREQLEYILKRRFGLEQIYVSFQYPLENGAGRYLNIDCPLVLRRVIQAALPPSSAEDNFLSVGLFSAYDYAKRVVPALERGRRLFWRASEGSPDQFLEIQDGEFQALHFFEREPTTTRHLKTVGNSRLEKPIVAFVEELAEGQDAIFPEVESVFVYLGSGGAGFLEQVLLTDQTTLSLLNPFWRWSWPEVPEADNRFTQSAFTELAAAIWMI